MDWSERYEDDSPSEVLTTLGRYFVTKILGNNKQLAQDILHSISLHKTLVTEPWLIWVIVRTNLVAVKKVASNTVEIQLKLR